MQNLDELINAAKHAVNASSNTEFGAQLGVSRQTVSNWKRHENTPDEKTVAKMARLTGTDAGEALLLLQIAKAKTEKDRQFWKRFLPTITVWLIAITLIALTFEAKTASAVQCDKLYIMRNRRRWLKARRYAPIALA